MKPIVSRRTFLQAVGVNLALPLLESTGLRGAPAGLANAPRRLVAMNFALGLHGPNFFPEQAGAGYAPSPYLAALGKELRDRLTVISGTSHPDVTLGHASDSTFLTAARFPGAPTFRNSISLDQYLVEKLKPDTRFPSMSFGTRGGTISFSRSGVVVPPDTRPSAIFTKMFVNGTKSEVSAQVRRLEDGRSVLDAVLSPAKQLQARVSAPDRERLDQYFSAVRDLEQRMVGNQEWATKPKPVVAYKAPKDVSDPNDDLARLKLMMDLIYLAVQTDSTRFLTLYVGGSNAVQPIPGVNIEYHSLSHHGQDPEKLSQLKIIQTRQMEAVGGLLKKLNETKEGGHSLLDHTSLLFGSAMGNASSHNCKNLPIVLAGGRFKHGQHLAFSKDENTPLCRVYVSMLQSLGVETDQFATGKGTLPGLEFKA
ncbi:MAG: DUF1552 domain-containing protein [Verrucomicrobia bacterium]|nr:DUF1552 domain-containing protein [Verrucomicrobiota bacterium]